MESDTNSVNYIKKVFMRFEYLLNSQLKKIAFDLIGSNIAEDQF